MNSNNVKFYLNILEISGKDIANIYVNDIRHKLDNRKLKYHFDIITDEDFYNVRKHTMSGGKTTFPYNHFENTFNNMRNIIQFNKDSSFLFNCSFFNSFKSLLPFAFNGI